MARNHDDETTDIEFDPEGSMEEDTGPTLPPGGYYGDESEQETDLLDQYKDDTGGDTVLDRPSKAAHGFLVPAEGSHEGKPEPIDDGTTVGREEGDVVLGDPKVSNPHAKFRLEDDVFILWDFGSKNGTFVNGEQIICATPLEDGDEIRFGSSVFYLKVLVPPKKKTRKIAKKAAARKRKKAKRK